MLQVHFLDTDSFQFTESQRADITELAEEADALVRTSLPLAEQAAVVLSRRLISGHSGGRKVCRYVS
jgi:hypothetical protein